MPTIRVDLADQAYDIVVEDGLISRAGSCIQRILPTQNARIAVISDETVARLHGQALTHSLEEAGLLHTLHTVPAGEPSKSWACTETLCREMIRSGHDRHSLVVALGGGVVGDLAGFVAAIFQRGIPIVQVPTTIVAQVDSSVGGKTGINLPEGKNLVGAFHQPRLVLADPTTLRTLPNREFREGFAEIIKHAAIRDPEMLDALEAIDPDDRNVPSSLIARNVSIKARIVEIDEHETLGIRALLNFGHTIGHAIEAAVPYGSLLHGEAISLGMRAALSISERHAQLDPAVTERILAALERFHLPLTLPESIETQSILRALRTDKKFAAGHIRFVVLEAAGRARLVSGLDESDLAEAIEHLRNPP
jgi:3-dehydroquinate synthase